MFIDVTRFGGMRVMRLAVPAIAYLDAVEGGTAVHLIGGETVRVNEDPEQIEARVDATIALSPIAVRPATRITLDTEIDTYPAVLPHAPARLPARKARR
jgi:hypothetical protein